jgi:NHS family xanthosine MFS transporter
MMMTKGFGALLGSQLSGMAIAKYFTYSNSELNWHGIWTAFAIYALIVAILFAVFFKHKHVREEVTLTAH